MTKITICEFTIRPGFFKKKKTYGILCTKENEVKRFLKTMERESKTGIKGAAYIKNSFISIDEWEEVAKEILK